MKKVLIGILILIPIIILLVVALVTNMLQLQAWIAVTDMTVTIKGTDVAASNLELYLNVNTGEEFDLDDWVDVAVFPYKANRYTVEWEFKNLTCTDADYEQQNPTRPAATLVDSAGRDADGNTSGKFKVYAYCNFYVTVRAEAVKHDFFVNIKGDTVYSVSLTDLDGNDEGELTVGESARLCASYVPIDSIITKVQYESDDAGVISVDKNGVITAVGAGSTYVTATADKYDGTGTVTSNRYEVTVKAGASKYGDKVTLERTQDGKYSFEQLGIKAQDVDPGENYTVQDDGIVINGEGAMIALKGGKSLDVTLCNENDIVIENAALYAQEGGYVLGVGEAGGLALGVKFASALKQTAPQSVTWRSENAAVATVTEQGVVTGVSDGVATITATVGEKTASITLNVQTKVTLLRLKTSNESLEAGLARETVFASYKYVYKTDAEGGSNKFAKEANGFEISIHGEPENATPEELAAFYARYKIEVAEGGEYAHIDEQNPRKVVFNADAMEGKGKVDIKVKASAKYPRFEANQSHTTDYVTLHAVYGVEVNTFEQAIRAGDDQKEYVLQDGNVIERRTADTVTAPDGQEYIVEESQRANKYMAMTLGTSIRVPEDKKVQYHWQGNSDARGVCVTLYGNLYGNGYTISAKPEQVDGWDSYLVHVAISDVTISNVILRHQDIDVEKLDSTTYKNSRCIILEAMFGGRLNDERVEYTVFENAKGGIDALDCDLTIDGSVFRNLSSIGIYSVARVSGQNLTFTHINMNNTVFTSLIGIAMNFSWERYGLSAAGQGRFTSKSGADGVQESYKWIEEVLTPKGYVSSLNQTGFLDIYNWQDSSDATLIDTTDPKMNRLIGTMVGPVLTYHPEFQPGVYHGKNGELDVDYFHLGFMESGISFSDILNEHTFTKITMEDNRFFSIRTSTLRYDYPGLNPTVRDTVRSVLNLIEVTLYSYRNDVDITPDSFPDFNNQFINHLHGVK